MHTLELPQGNQTTDNQILEVADAGERVVVTKDDDFVQSYLIAGRPAKLLLVSTGNFTNDELEVVVQTHLPRIVQGLESGSFIELGRESLTIHE